MARTNSREYDTGMDAMTVCRVWGLLECGVSLMLSECPGLYLQCPLIVWVSKG